MLIQSLFEMVWHTHNFQCKCSAHAGVMSYPFCRNRNKFEDKSLDATTCAQAKLLCVQFLHDSFVEVSYEGCHKHEDGVLCHKRFWQAIPTKSVVHDIEETFLATQKIVELHDVSYT